MNKITQVLDARGIRQTWLTEKLGKSVNMVNSYTLNKTQPSQVTLFQIAELLKVEMDRPIYGREELNKIQEQQGI